MMIQTSFNKEFLRAFSKSDLQRYRNAILNLLSKVKIDNCDSEQKENLKAVYELLSHLEPEPTPSKSAPIKELDQPLLKN